MDYFRHASDRDARNPLPDPSLNIRPTKPTIFDGNIQPARVTVDKWPYLDEPMDPVKDTE